MPVWRVTINNIKAERSSKAPEGITVEVKPSLVKAEIEDAGTAKLVRTDYKLAANYEPNVGKIEIEGSIYFIGVDPKKALEKGKLSDVELIRQAYQRIFLEPMVTAIGLAKELRLPLPVKMPEIKVEDKTTKKK